MSVGVVVGELVQVKVGVTVGVTVKVLEGVRVGVGVKSQVEYLSTCSSSVVT